MMVEPNATANAGALVCWQCGTALTERLPLRREARCNCGADLHCCRLCRNFEPQWRQGCREQRAEEPRSREAANFCDWFKPKPGAHGGDSPAAAQRDALSDLFKK